MVPIRVEAGVVEAPEPVTLAEMRLYLRLDPDDASEDALVTGLVAAARASLEAETRRLLKPARFRVVLDAWPRDRRIPLPLSPLVGVLRLGLAGPDGSVEAQEASLLRVGPDPIEAPCLLVDPFTPAPVGRTILIEVAAGYGGGGPVLPAPLRLAILRLAAACYEHRGDETEPPDPAALATPFRRLRL
ncbi:head-tail connector protein [Methylobacterium radiodurans]|uniref:PhiE125 gp8 family phage protein n=1 Tax=Methylobacterium radiodurans TaxID=2202828 RepID=A0A2U8VNF3_9HYPH|nr:phage head-tail connector protein [Methylobacterium radiodurans]AWN35219.1 hypothetical protein DK427_05275 [Methylobacterium radiodurans]